MAEELPKVYEGDRPYIFVNYAHADDRAVLPIIDALIDEGYRVWYDDGIQPAADFPDHIADHIHDCACVLMLVSHSYLDSVWCRNEVSYALDMGKTILPVYLEDIELGRALHMRLGTVQALFWHLYDSDEAFYKDLFAARALNCCLTDQDRWRRGVRSKDGESKTIEFLDSSHPNLDYTNKQFKAKDSSKRVHAPNAISKGRAFEDEFALCTSMGSDKIVDTFGITRKDKLADYSWSELKLLSSIIAKAKSDAEGLAIAKVYRLVNAEGRLQGMTKDLKLANERYANVRILGFRHDNMTVGGKAGISFEFADVPTTHHMNAGWTNAGGWELSGMRKWLNSDFSALLPNDLRSNIIEVKKMTCNMWKACGNNNCSVITETTDKLWLLSMSEVYGVRCNQPDGSSLARGIYSGEGIQYQYYANYGMVTGNYDSHKTSGANPSWWLRSLYTDCSPCDDDSHRFCFVDSRGDWNSCSADVALGVSPGFCL